MKYTNLILDPDVKWGIRVNARTGGDCSIVFTHPEQLLDRRYYAPIRKAQYPIAVITKVK